MGLIMQLVQDMYANLNNADLDSVVENTNKAPYVSIWDRSPCALLLFLPPELGVIVPKPLQVCSRD